MPWTVEPKHQCASCNELVNRRATHCWRHKLNGQPPRYAQLQCRDCGTDIVRQGRTPIGGRCQPCAYQERKRKNGTIRTCSNSHCARLFHSHGVAASRKYCSRSCWRAVVGQRPAIIEAQCKRCGRAFKRTRAALARVTNAYCSPRCAGQARRIRRCEQCGIETNNRKFCSRRCAQLGSKMSRGGGRWKGRGPGWTRIAASIRDRDGHRCRRCGLTESENGKKLPVDHIVPWRMFGPTIRDTANLPRNLVTLCTSCHSRKTSRAERLWLIGDETDFATFVRAINTPSLLGNELPLPEPLGPTVSLQMATT